MLYEALQRILGAGALLLSTSLETFHQKARIVIEEIFNQGIQLWSTPDFLDLGPIYSLRLINQIYQQSTHSNTCHKDVASNRNSYEASCQGVQVQADSNIL